MPRRRTTTQRGYGARHQAEKRRWAPIVKRGDGWCAEITCLLPSRWIDPRQRWDLAHDRTNPGQYLGPAHARCNRSEGATYGNKLRGSQKRTERRWRL